MNDLRLAKHIAYVHQNSTTPETDINPLDMKTMRRYIAQCKKKMPIIPKELTEYITENYVLLREESRTQRKAGQGLFTSARTLLAILRMSTSLARLRLVDVVEKDDVKEAMRLMEYSKTSMKDDDTNRPVTRVIDRIYQDIIKLKQDGQKSMKVGDIKDICQAVGYKPTDIDECLEAYEEPDIWQLNQAKTKHTFIN
jgi:DNA replication licensing factor MCM7